VLDPDLRIIYVNQAVDRMLGRPPETILGRHAFELIHPDDVVSAIDALAQVGDRPAVALRLAHADGRWIPTEVAGDTSLSDPDVGGIVINIRDVTDRLRVEETLHSERRFLRTILHEMEDGVAAYGPDGRLRMINRAAREFFGMADRDVGPADWATEYELYEADGVTPLADADTPVQRALRGEPVPAREMVVVPRHGPRRVLWTSGRPIFDADGVFVGAVSAMHDVTTNREAEARLQHQALHDPLTGLPNRVLLLDRLCQAMSRAAMESGQVALLFLDLDRFKIVNDGLGHRVGDRLLQDVAVRLTSAVRDGDTVGRLGGDEFVVLCAPVAGVADAVAVAERIEAELAAPFRLDHRDVRVSASIGIAMTTPRRADGVDLAAPEALLRDADAAMYRAKDLGRARLEVFDEATRRSVLHRLEVEQRLARAIEQGWLRALYQPVLDVKTGQIVGVEALIRYIDPQRGLVVPEEFLAVAEDSGLITRLDSWILNQACRDARRWDGQNTGRPLQVGVNVSARQLSRADFYDVVAAALKATGLEPGRLALEITESELVEATPTAISATHRLRALGVHVGADDFGTGYSSLIHIKRFPVSFLKVDRSFVDGLPFDQDDAAIVEAVISLGHALGLTVVAEGVETEAQLTQLRALGCDSYQGFLYSRPTEADKIEEMLVRPRASA